MNTENPAPQEPQSTPPGKPAESAPTPSVAPSATPSGNGKKDSTSELPMFDLEEVITFVDNIHTKGLETAKIPEVAAGFNYKSASSTPFYRRLTAARLFGLLHSSGAELTVRARDYIQPTSEESKHRALSDAVYAVPFYAEQLGKLAGKRLNAELVANEIARTFNVSDICAKTCAKAFELSIRFAGLLGGDHVVRGQAAKTAASKPQNVADQGDHDEDQETQRHTLFLDKTKKRKFLMTAPITVTSAELTRICNWLTVTLIVEEPEETKPQDLL